MTTPIGERVALIVFCGECHAGHVRRPGRLGAMVVTTNGAALWRWRNQRSGESQVVVRTARGFVNPPAPATLPALCRPRHGGDFVDAGEVLKAYDAAIGTRVSNLVLPLHNA